MSWFISCCSIHSTFFRAKRSNKERSLNQLETRSYEKISSIKSEEKKKEKKDMRKKEKKVYQFHRPDYFEMTLQRWKWKEKKKKKRKRKSYLTFRLISCKLLTWPIEERTEGSHWMRKLLWQELSTINYSACYSSFYVPPLLMQMTRRRALYA